MRAMMRPGCYPLIGGQEFLGANVSGVSLPVNRTHGRALVVASAACQAQRMGADGLLADDGLHRTAGTSGHDVVSAAQAADLQPPRAQTMQNEAATSDLANGEPVLTADELRALLAEQPAMPPAGGSEL